MSENYVLFIVLALLSEIIGTVSGFGSSILFVPIASLFFDFTTVLGITAVFHVFSNISKILFFKKGVQKEIVIKLGLPAVLFVIGGAYCTKFIPVLIMELSMNIMLMMLSFYLLFHINKIIQPTDCNLYIGGSVSGFLAGLVGTGGAIRGLTLTAFNLPKDIFIATSALIDLGVDSSRALMYISQGYFQSKYIIFIPFLIVISIVGNYLGKRILTMVSEIFFRYIVLIVIIGTTILQLIKFSSII
jgi:uncharacterized membrane protein YfcA